MPANIAGNLAISKMESVTGVVRKVGAVGKMRLEMDVMVVLGELINVNVCFTQVCTVWTVKYFFLSIPSCIEVFVAMLKLDLLKDPLLALPLWGV